MRLHVLILGDIHEGGEWISVTRLAKAVQRISEQKVTFSVIGFVGTYKPQLTFARSARFISRSSAKKPWSFFKKLLRDFFHARGELRHFLREHNDVELFWATDFLMAIVAFSVRPRVRTKIMFHFQGLRSVFIRNWSDADYRQLVIKTLERLAILCADIIVVPSRFAKSFVLSMVGPFGKQKSIYVIQNSIPVGYFRSYSSRVLRKFRRRVGLTTSGRIILYVGRITRYKGIKSLVDAFVQYRQESHKAVLVLAYPKSSAEEKVLNGIKQKIETTNIAKAVQMIPDLSTRSLVALYQTASILVLPSEFEMAPLVVIEALASGTPCLVTNVANVGNIITSINPLLLLKNNSAREILHKLLYFFRQTEKTRKHIRLKSKEVARQYQSKNTENHFYRLIESFAEK